jgi:hypothetical protein
MPLSSIFKIRYEVTPEILELLNAAMLGTNGAMYRHLDTSQRIQEADDPIYLSVERNKKVIGNVTFCRRGDFWYIRYFAFGSSAQAGSNKTRNSKGNSQLKRELNAFFDEVFSGDYSDITVQSMYAYIDPKNARSKWMSENFGFKVIGQLATQSFSRITPKKTNRLDVINYWKEIQPLVEREFGDYSYYYSIHSEKPPFYILRNDKNEIIAFSRITTVHWEINRLPGKRGKFLTKAIPYIPLLNKIIKPKNHIFLVPDLVYIQGNDPSLLVELFDGILFVEKKNLILWWVDSKDPFYLEVKDKTKWGLLHKLIGVNPVDVVERKHPENKGALKEPIFVSAWDLV